MKSSNVSFNISCKATNCVHNKNCDCMAGAIIVKGPEATNVAKTTCDTFVVEGGYAFDNFSSYYDNEKTKTKIETIKCSAKHCIHNENSVCYADCVEIIAANASCGAFECRS